jgi:sugar phosphate isomerase/epimerase
MNRLTGDRLAVCSWSLQPSTPQQLATQLKEIGLGRLQVALDPLREKPGVWGSLAAEMNKAGLQLISGMFGTVGEDYSTPETIRRTGGIVPDSTWEQNWKNIRQTVELAKHLQLSLVTFHAGFLPHDPKDPDYAKLLERLRKIADVFAAERIDLALETGQETAVTLREFLEQLDRRNVGVNFDPANMILYEKGNPIEALRTLAPWLKQCHIKDARKTKVPGTWGDEVVVGTGEVPWAEFFRVLEQSGFGGYFAIEREAGSQRLQDIRVAREFVDRL